MRTLGFGIQDFENYPTTQETLQDDKDGQHSKLEIPLQEETKQDEIEVLSPQQEIKQEEIKMADFGHVVQIMFKQDLYLCLESQFSSIIKLKQNKQSALNFLILPFIENDQILLPSSNYPSIVNDEEMNMIFSNLTNYQLNDLNQCSMCLLNIET